VAWHGVAGVARFGSAWHGVAGVARFGAAWPGLAWPDLARHGRYGLSRLGPAGFGWVRRVSARQVSHD